MLFCMGRNHGGRQEGGAPSLFKEIPGHDMVVHFIYTVQGYMVFCKDFIFNAAGIGAVFQKDEGQGTAVLYGWGPVSCLRRYALGTMSSSWSWPRISSESRVWFKGCEQSSAKSARSLRR